MVASTESFSASKATRKSPGANSRAAAARREALHDMELVHRFNAGDETAFVEIMRRYHEKMFAIAFALLRNHADAEEVAQDTFIRAHRALVNFRGDSSLATWLHRIALNLSRNRYWYFFRRHRHTTVSLDQALSENSPTTFCDLVATDEPGPAHAAQTTEFTALVAICMERLGPGSRAVLSMRNIKNRSYGEIAQELGVKVGTVKSRIARAREMLRALLAEACPEFGEDAEPAEWFEATPPSGGINILCA